MHRIAVIERREENARGRKERFNERERSEFQRQAPLGAIRTEIVFDYFLFKDRLRVSPRSISFLC